MSPPPVSTCVCELCDSPSSLPPPLPPDGSLGSIPSALCVSQSRFLFSLTFRCAVGSGAKLNHSVLLPGARVAQGAIVQGSVVGPRATVGDGCVLKSCQVTAGSTVPNGSKV